MNWDPFAERLASTEPTPGGGAAAARVGHIVSALTAKVIRLSLRRAKDTAFRTRLEELERRVCNAATGFLELEAEDENAFRSLLAAMKGAREDKSEIAQSALQKASVRAATAPLAIMELAARLLVDIAEICELATQGLLRAESDVPVAAELLMGCYDSGVWTVRVNLPYLSELDRAELETRWLTVESKMRPLHDNIRKLMDEHIGGKSP